LTLKQASSLPGVPELDENERVWTETWDWSTEGDEWSTWWGGSEAMWYGALLPRIHAFVPTGTILEIAPGYGRWTQHLKDVCERLVGVDLAENCVEHCKERFRGSNAEFHVNDGRSLDMVEDGSVDFAFSFDSLVHVERDVIAGYLEQLATKLSPQGIGFIHHSNIGAYPRNTALARRVPPRFLRPLIKRSVVVDMIAWRAESVTAETFVEDCERVGLSCVAQEKISWESGYYLIDAISVLTRRGSRWDRTRTAVSNPLFRAEARRMARLYARTSFAD
jgi:2-polyprenyl-3-methyl-5-hydroxy-6-metoxy-1,4-benzoquinol methylase